MHKLSNIQHTIHDAHFKGLSMDAERLIVPYGLSGTQRLNIYRNNTFITLTDALSKTYPVINKLVGDDFFTHTASEFIKKHPPHPGPLFEYGEEFPVFLDDFEAASSLPYLGDVAHLEWAMNVAYHAPEATPLHVSELLGIPENKLAELCINIHPSCLLITSKYPVDKIWTVNQPDEEVIEIELNQGVDIIVIRPEETVEFHIIDSGTSEFFKSLKQGNNVEHAFASTLSSNQEFNPAGALIDLLTIGAFIAINVAPNHQI
tara:strand:- start:60808 stop:61590 length:783 start_codon:yes stop_codon:yes gene_type:complete